MRPLETAIELRNGTGDRPRVGYILKRYPRYSETFIVNEILAHEEAGLDVAVYALRPPADTHFQGLIGRVRAPVRYLETHLKSPDWWHLLHTCGELHPNTWRVLNGEHRNTPRNGHQALELAILLKRDGITHMHAHFATDAAGVARLASKISGIPYSLTAHAKDIFHESVDLTDLRAKVDAANRVITVSDYNVAYLEDILGGSPSNLTRIYNGIDLDSFAYVDPSDRRPIIVAIGRIVEKKGFEFLVDACSILKDRGRRFTCRIVGTGELEDALKTQIVERGVSDVVTLTGPRPSDEVVRELRQAALLAAPCIVGEDGNRDGLPTVLLEAMALGTPCISTDVTGIPEAIIDESTGLQVPQMDPRSLANGIERLLEDESLRIRLARNARALVELEFDIRRNAAKIRDVFISSHESAHARSGSQVVPEGP